MLVGVSARDLPKQAQQTSKKTPPGGTGAAQEAPEPAKAAPGRPPRDARSAPRAPQEPPKFGFRAALAAKWSPLGALKLSEGLREAILDPLRCDFPGSKGSRKPFWTPPRCDFPPSGVQFSHGFPSGKHVQNCPVGKAYASIRPASLDVPVHLLHVDEYGDGLEGQEVLINVGRSRRLFDSP